MKVSEPTAEPRLRHQDSRPADIPPISVAEACNHPNWLVLPFHCTLVFICGVRFHRAALSKFKGALNWKMNGKGNGVEMEGRSYICSQLLG